MANKVEVIENIRFSLEQLSVKNAQHEFEHMCRHIARKRISINIIPATGPVQAGGDQGRDFETVRSFLNNSSIKDSTFLSHGEKHPIVFACSLQQNPESNNGKIMSDVSNIIGSGGKIKAIYFFSSRDINVSKRHDLISWAKSKYEVDLEILDAQAISEWLSDHDLFWIANHFLRIPNEIYPRPEDEKDWYKKMRKEWEEKKQINFALEEFEDVRIGARYVYKSEELKQDLKFWIEKLELFLVDKTMEQLRMRAIYEICVDSIVAYNHLQGNENLVREYFSDFDRFLDPAGVEDAAILLSFINTAATLGVVSIDKKEIGNWVKSLNEKIEYELKCTNNPNNICSLIETKAFSLVNLIAERDIEKLRDGYRNLIDTLNKLFDYLPSAPLFPLERLSERIKEYIKIFLENRVPLDFKPMEDLARKIDNDYLEKRYGAFKAADSSKNRALVYLENNKLIEAINLLHQVKLKWFADETLKGSLLSILILAETYQKLGMNFAAKYYALAGAHLSINTGKSELYKYLPKAISVAGDCDYIMGSWIGFFDLIKSLLITLSIVKAEALALEENNEIYRAIYYFVLIKYFNERLSFDLTHLIEQNIKDLGSVLQNDINQLYPTCKESFDKIEDDKLFQQINETFDYVLFNDVGEIRTIKWKAFGIVWETYFNNNYLTNSVAEQFLAILQILIVELSDIDLHNLRGKIIIEIRSEGLDNPTFVRDNTNRESRWVIKLPNTLEVNKDRIWEYQKYYFAIAISILYEFSMLKKEEFDEIFKKEFEDDLIAKIEIVQPYEILFRQFVPKNKFESQKRSEFLKQSLLGDFVLKERGELSLKSGVSPKYSKDQALKDIKSRYSKSLSPIQHTFNKIKKEEWFKEMIKELKKEKWLDWHLLIAIMNLIVSYKAQNIIGSNNDPNELKRVFKELVKSPESEEASLPAEVLSIKQMRTQLNFMFSSFALSWGLEPHNEVPNIEGIKEFMVARFKLLEDDIEHSSIFDE